jgi:hypothetical protein
VEGIDLTEVEREICRLPDVSVVRIVADATGRVTEVHVVAHEGKHPKQIVRDVQSVALASFDLEIDRRVVSVVQLGAEDEGAAREHVCGDVVRPAVTGITAESSGVRSLVRVTLTRDGDEVVGHAEGSIATTARYRLVANATIDALRKLDLADLVAGSAIVRAQHDTDAIARAVLDATNRRLPWARQRPPNEPGGNGTRSS